MASAGMTVLLVSHKLEDVITLCDEIAVLRAGVIVGQREMPATKAELVTLMFGEELALPEREHTDHSGDEANAAQQFNAAECKTRMARCAVNSDGRNKEANKQ